MKVDRGDPSGWDRDAGPSALTIGVFDGVHLGHRHVLSLLAAEASERGLGTAVMTFDPHPLTVVAPDAAPRLLTTVDQRLELLAAMGVDRTAVLPFSDRVRSLSPAAFVTEILRDALDARIVAVGEDFRFGRDRTGNVEFLREMGEGVGFETIVVSLVGDDSPVSSTRIRRLVADGDVAAATVLLGRHHEVRGEVVRGDGRGASIGVPTANLDLPDGVAVPARGVYAVRVGVDDEEHPGVANIGVRPTFGGEEETLEVHLLSGGRDLYGSGLAVRFVDRIRDERRFDGIEALVAQIGSDIGEARRILDA
ncbi:MAG: bifunctional riboflavin kinase/FAD synthetase [Acidimicrobiia bacterium]|nr:bifunctional riboflavin kinase/FAD synthetase [Acidimicrobiia bacterium]